MEMQRYTQTIGTTTSASIAFIRGIFCNKFLTCLAVVALHLSSPFHAPTHPPRAAPPEACGASNRWLGVVHGTKVVGKSHARACRRCLPAPRRFDLNVPMGGKRGGAGIRWIQWIAAFTTELRPEPIFRGCCG